MNPLHLTAEVLSSRLRRELAASGADIVESGSPSGGLTPAAVLVPLVVRESGVTVLLTQRSQNLHDHPGQISFPGGRLEADDASVEAAALRETFEEIGLHDRHVDILGRLPDYCTGTGFRVSPVVGLVAQPFELVVDAFEVDEVFEVPLAFLMDRANHQLHRREVAGRVREYVAMPFGERFIWGATAGMLVSLCDVLSRE